MASPMGSPLEAEAQTDAEEQTWSEPDAAAGLAWSKQPKAVVETARGIIYFRDRHSEGRTLAGYKLERVHGIKWTLWPASSGMAHWALLNPGHKPCCRASGGEIKDASLNALLRKWNCSVLVSKDTTHRPQSAPSLNDAGREGVQNVAETSK